MIFLLIFLFVFIGVLGLAFSALTKIRDKLGDKFSKYDSKIRKFIFSIVIAFWVFLLLKLWFNIFCIQFGLFWLIPIGTAYTACIIYFIKVELGIIVFGKMNDYSLIYKNLLRVFIYALIISYFLFFILHSFNYDLENLGAWIYEVICYPIILQFGLNVFDPKEFIICKINPNDPGEGSSTQPHRSTQPYRSTQHRFAQGQTEDQFPYSRQYRRQNTGNASYQDSSGLKGDELFSYLTGRCNEISNNSNWESQLDMLQQSTQVFENMVTYHKNKFGFAVNVYDNKPLTWYKGNDQEELSQIGKFHDEFKRVFGIYNPLKESMTNSLKEFKDHTTRMRDADKNRVINVGPTAIKRLEVESGYIETSKDFRKLKGKWYKHVNSAKHLDDFYGEDKWRKD